MAPALPVENFGTFPFRGQLSGRCLPVVSICGTEIKAQGRVENSIRVGSSGRSYFEPKCYESISQSAGRSSCRLRKVMWE
jgi:hypothetical protein